MTVRKQKGYKAMKIYRIIAAALAALMLVCAVSCGNKEPPADGDTAENKEYSFDTDVLAAEIAEKVSFGDSMVKLSDESASMRYVFGQEKITAYAGSGATAEVILVCSYADEDDAGKGAGYIASYIEQQKILFADYNVDEMPKLDSAFIGQYGRYTVCVVAADVSAVDGIVNGK